MTLEELKAAVIKTKKIDTIAFIVFALAMVAAMICIPFTESYNIPGAIMCGVALVFFVIHIVSLNKLNKYEAMLKDIIEGMKKDADDEGKTL
ncbi:MAG: hypothetical protein IJL71_05345 [Oscillospiraceae bacterium]|nr:hypothetical protein [Oscillospiraceae bacterium]